MCQVELIPALAESRDPEARQSKLRTTPSLSPLGEEEAASRRHVPSD